MRVLPTVTAVFLAFVMHASAGPYYNTGPYAGALEEGDSATHRYDNNATDSPCIDLARPYSILVEIVPAHAAVRVEANGYSTVATRGSGGLTFWSGVCTEFDIVVTALRADPAVVYAIEVVPGSPATLGDWS